MQVVRMTFACVGPFLQFTSISLVACVLAYMNLYLTKLKANAVVFNFFISRRCYSVDNVMSLIMFKYQTTAGETFLIGH